MSQRAARCESAVLTREGLEMGLRELARRDPDLARVVNRHGPPPMWEREPGFPTLVLLILEQQVSLASARAAYDRLMGIVSPLSPEGFLELDDRTLRGIGFSRQKTRYCRLLAECLVQGRLDLKKLSAMDDDSARAVLMSMKGIGPWTADIYLLMALRRPDIWPTGDLALAVAAGKLKGTRSRPTETELHAMGESWRPWRAVAARILWHFYLSENSPRT